MSTRTCIGSLALLLCLALLGCGTRDQGFSLSTSDLQNETADNATECCRKPPRAIVAARINPESVYLHNGAVLEESRFLVVGHQAWRLLGEPITLSQELTREIGQLVGQHHASPPKNVRKLCGPIKPVIALQMEADNGDHCWVLICFMCADWGFYPGTSSSSEVFGDFTEIHDPLLRLMKAAFPADTLIQSIPERGSPATKTSLFR